MALWDAEDSDLMGPLMDALGSEATMADVKALAETFGTWKAQQRAELWSEFTAWFTPSENGAPPDFATNPQAYLAGMQQLLTKNLGFLQEEWIRKGLLAIAEEPLLKFQWDTYLKQQHFSPMEFWGTVRTMETQKHNMGYNDTEITAQSLLAKSFTPIRWFASGLLHEGMVLFGGRSKRGKSWVAMNMAVSLAQGDKVFGQYEVAEPRKVLYGALEDGPRRTQRRLQLMAADPALDNLLIAFKMPPLAEGGVDYLAEKIKEGYEVIFVDVLAHLEKAGKNGLPNYHEVYSMFAPLQVLRSEHQFALVMITHLRKGESEEVFDALHGSVAYQGTQDALWVMERRMGDDLANVHVRDKDAEDKTIQLRFDGEGTWSFVGEGEEHTTTTEESAILAFLLQEKQPQRVQEIMLALGIPQSRYAAFRQRLVRMVSKQSILRTDHGKYAALASSGWE